MSNEQIPAWVQAIEAQAVSRSARSPPSSRRKRNGRISPAHAQRIQDSARAANARLIWAVEERAGRFFAWGGLPDLSGGTRVSGELVAKSLQELRDMLPAGLTRHERTTVASEIVETWD